MTVTPIPSAQIHPSLNNPHSLEETIPPHRQGTPSISNLATTTDSTPPSTRRTVNLVLPQRTLEEINQVLTSTPVSHICSKVHTPHPAMLITMKKLYTIQGLVQSDEHQLLPNQTILHYLLLTAVSPLIPRDRLLHLTMDNIVYELILPYATTLDTPHRLHLFLNPHNRILYLRHIHDVDERTTRRLEITTTLPSKSLPPSGPNRRPMMRTTTHIPDLVTTLIFPANSLHYQILIMTLVTHLLLTVPNITSRQSMGIIRDVESHHNTLQLILATITLKQYHQVWYTILNVRQYTATPLSTLYPLIIPVSESHIDTSLIPLVRPSFDPRHRSTKRKRQR